MKLLAGWTHHQHLTIIFTSIPVSPCPHLDCTSDSPGCSHPSPSPSQSLPRFSPPSAQNGHSSALAFLSFQAAHCRFRYNLLRSMRMQPLWGPRPGLINVWNSLQRLAPMLGTQLNDDLLELMFPKGIPRTNCSKLGWPLQNFYYPESSEIEFSGTSPVVQW